jgi:dipeptidyl aminopeptidase/acylaminoacyl peptidase
VATGGTWNRDGIILFGGSTVGPILRVSAAGGVPTAVTAVKFPEETFHSTPYFLPDGRHFLYHVTGAATSRGIYVGQLEGDTPPTRVLERDAPALFAAPGHLVFVDRGTLYSQPFDPDRLAITGEATPIAEQVMIDAIGVVPAVSVSAVGSIVYRTGTAAGQRQFVWSDRAGREVGRLGSPDSATAQNPSQSPDGRLVALNRTVNGNSDVWLLDTARGLLTRFTVADTIDVNPIWSPDGAYIAYGSNRRGVFDLYRKRLASAEPEELLATGEGSKAPLDWSRDGRFLLYRNQHPKNGWDVLGVSVDGARTPFAVVQTEFDETNAQFSADGRWIAYQSNESGNVEIYVRSFPSAGTKIRISTTGGTQPRWRDDGLELFYVALDGRLMAVPITSESVNSIVAGAPVSLFSTSIGSMGQGALRQQYMVSPDGQRFLINTIPEANTPITILLNAR